MKDPGFTLIEVLIAAALVLFLASGISQLGISSVRSEQRARVVQSAIGVLAECLESLKSLPYEDERLSPGSHLEDVPSPAAGGRFTFEYSVEETAPGLKELRTTLIPDGRRASAIRLRLYILKGLETAR